MKVNFIWKEKEIVLTQNIIYLMVIMNSYKAMQLRKNFEYFFTCFLNNHILFPWAKLQDYIKQLPNEEIVPGIQSVKFVFILKVCVCLCVFTIH